LAFRGFIHSAINVCNDLPDNIRQSKVCGIFKRKLKTHLCKLTFGTKRRTNRLEIVSLHTAREIFIYLLSYLFKLYFKTKELVNYI